VNVSYSTRLDKSNLSALLSDERFAGARSRLDELWKKFDFAKAQRNVSRLQARIVKAFQNGMPGKAHQPSLWKACAGSLETHMYGAEGGRRPQGLRPTR